MSKMTVPVTLVLTTLMVVIGCSCNAARTEAAPAAGPNSEIRAARLPVIPCGDCDRWSDPATWGGATPKEGQDVTIPKGKRIVLDEDPPPLGGITIDGDLLLARKDLSIEADWIVVHGSLRGGTAEAPLRQRITITLKGADPDVDVMGMGTRGLMVMNGTVELYGNRPDKPWVRLSDHARAGATHLTLDVPSGWDAGEQIAIAPTDFYGRGETERATIEKTTDRGIGIRPALATGRYGKLQYATEHGMSETDRDRIEPPATPTPTILDERAEVALLSRNIVIQGPDDALWKDKGFGAHIMVMGQGSVAKLVGVEIRRGGQRGRLARYPIHWHLISYDESGKELGDADGHLLEGSAIWDSAQRCIVIHGTNGVTAKDNVCYDIEGHGIFFEDAVERRNTIVGNAVLKVRNPKDPMKVHEGPVFMGGSSGVWLTNPDNEVVGNVVADAEGAGYWLSFPKNPTGPNADVPLHPYVMSLGKFEDNTAHSNMHVGLNLDFAVIDEAGNVRPISYQPTKGMRENSPADWERFQIRRFTTYKHRRGGMWNRVIWPDYLEFVSADNQGFYFAGAGKNGLIARSLLVGHSLNRSPLPEPDMPPVAFATYHSTYDMTKNVVVNFPFVAGKPSGVFATNDYYIRAVEKGMLRNGRNRLVDSHPGFRSPRESPDFAFAGALWDPHGYFGKKKRYWTYDDPFLTSGAECVPVQPAGMNGMSCDGPFYGVSGFVVDRKNKSYDARMGIAVTRQSSSGKTLGKWVVDNGEHAKKLGNMRHFAALKGGRYLLRFPDGAAPRDVGMRIESARTPADSFVLGVHFSRREKADVYVTTIENYFEDRVERAPSGKHKEIYESVGSLREVSASKGGVFYQDKRREIVWVKIRGGLRDAYVQSKDPTTDERLYEPMYLRIR